MTKDQKQLHADLRDMGCAVSKFVFGHDETPADIHHIVDGGKRKGDNWVIPLSPQMHRQGTRDYPSIHSVNGGHGGKSAFYEAYGMTEYDLLVKCEEWLGYAYRYGA